MDAILTESNVAKTICAWFEAIKRRIAAPHQRY
jgi:hypothetical protein